MTCDLVVDSTSPGIDLSILRDGELVAQGDSTLRVSVSAGRYSIAARTTYGDWSTRDEIDVTDSSARHVVRAGTSPALIPLAGGLPKVFDHHRVALEGALRSLEVGRRAGGLVIMHRQVSKKGARSLPEALEVDLLDPALRLVRNLRRQEVADRRRPPFPVSSAGHPHDIAVWSARLPPGAFTARLRGRSQAIPVLAGRTTVMVVPAIGEQTALALAAMFTLPADQAPGMPPDALDAAENLFGFLRVGLPIGTPWLIERARSHPDPLIRLISTSQLLRRRPETELPELGPLLTALAGELPEQWELVAQLVAMGEHDGPIANPPLLLETYRQLESAIGTRALQKGSYAEHSAAAMFDTGLWFAWSDAERQPEAELSADLPFLSDYVDSVVAEDSASISRSALVGWLASLLRHLPWLSRASRELSSRAAGWRSAGLLQTEAMRISELAEQRAHLTSSTPAYAFVRTDPSTLSREISGTARVASNVHDELTKRLEVSPMTMKPTTTDDSSSPTDDGPRALSGPVLWTAIAVLAAFGALVIWMLSTADTQRDAAWQRQVYVYASVEAIVFASAGALFGVQVQRGQVASAEQRAAASDAEAAEAKRSERRANAEAERGRAQAAAIRGMAAAAAPRAPAQAEESAPGSSDGPSRSAAPRATGVPSDTALAALRNVANELFPPTGGGV
jgi:hypothetical protein